jgi:hypothetical protein
MPSLLQSPIGLMLFRETVAVYCENTEHTKALCGQNAEFWRVEVLAV